MDLYMSCTYWWLIENRGICAWQNERYTGMHIDICRSKIQGTHCLVSMANCLVQQQYQDLIVARDINFFFLIWIPCLLQSVRRHLVTVVSIVLEACRRYFQWSSFFYSQSHGLVLSLVDVTGLAICDEVSRIQSLESASSELLFK